MPWRLPLEHDHRIASTVGPLTIVGGAGDFDARGAIRSPGDLIVQVDGALANVAEALAAEGCGLADVIRLKAFYLSDGARDEWEVVARLLGRFADDPFPAVTANPVPMQPFEGQQVQVQALAVKGWRGRRVQAVTRRVPAAARRHGLERVTQGLRAGEFLVVPGQTAVDEDDRVAAPGNGIVQTRLVMARLNHTLAELGATLQDTIKKEGYYFGTTMDEWAAMARERARFFHDPGPVATVVPCHLLQPAGLVTKVEVLGMRTEGDKYVAREDRWPPTVWDWPIPVPYRQGLRLRDMIWVGGQVPFEPGTNAGRAVHVGDPDAQVGATMDFVEAIVRAFGAGRASYRWLTGYFASDGTERATRRFVHALARAVDGPLPPMTIVPQPAMHAADMTTEIWAVAAP